MPGAGTDKTKNWVRAAGAGGDPGRAAARREHRRGGARHGEFRARRGCGWSSRGRAGRIRRRARWPRAPTASSTRRVLYDTLEEAIADCTLVLATTARAHDQAKPVVDAAEAARRWPRRGSRRARPSASCSAASASGLKTTRSRSPTGSSPCRSIRPSPRSISAQAVVIIAYEWFKLATGGALPFAMPVEVAAGGEAAVARLLRSTRARAGEGRVLPPARQARHHADQPAQHLHPHGADPAGHPHAARRHHGDRRRPQGAGARRRAQRRRGGAAAHAARRARPGPGAERARAGARAGAAAAPQSDRGRAHLLGCVHRATGVSSARASSGRCRSARTSPTWCRSRCGW